MPELCNQLLSQPVINNWNIQGSSFILKKVSIISALKVQLKIYNNSKDTIYLTSDYLSLAYM